MFDAVLIGRKMPKATWKEVVPGLRERLLDAQFDLADTRAAGAVLLITGVRAAGRGEVINTLLGWLDPRRVRVHDLHEPSDEERQRPGIWRFCRRLPARGEIAVFFGGWYQPLLEARLKGELSDDHLEHELRLINRFEQLLSDENILLVKACLHIDQQEQKDRLQALWDDKTTRWRVSREDRDIHQQHSRIVRALEELVSITDTAHAPWTLIEATDRRYRDVTLARLLADRLRDLLDAPAVEEPRAVTPLPDVPNVLSRVDLHQHLPKADYKPALREAQEALGAVVTHRKFRKHSAVIVFEGLDAAGKGGCIRRITEAIDSRYRTVVSVDAPDEHERLYPYLWRFWQELPGHGQLTLFDRSWYGRVLVERVEGLCSSSQLERAYEEINLFEQELIENGTRVIKFWLAFSPEEQLRRFREREQSTIKAYKLTEDDWRNRARWDDYQRAACDMIERTSTPRAPWHLIAAEDKRHARVSVLNTLVDSLR